MSLHFARMLWNENLCCNVCELFMRLIKRILEFLHKMFLLLTMYYAFKAYVNFILALVNHCNINLDSPFITWRLTADLQHVSYLFSCKVNNCLVDSYLSWSIKLSVENDTSTRRSGNKLLILSTIVEPLLNCLTLVNRSNYKYSTFLNGVQTEKDATLMFSLAALEQ